MKVCSSKNITTGLLKLGFSSLWEGSVCDKHTDIGNSSSVPRVVLCRIKREHDVDFVCKRSRLCSAGAVPSAEIE